jgi:hypothetical protein
LTSCDFGGVNKQIPSQLDKRAEAVKQSGNQSWHKNRLSVGNLFAQPGVFK